MTAPTTARVPAPSVATDPPEVRFDVRVGRDRPTTLTLGESEFLIGGAEGCDLRLPGTHLPPVVGRIARGTDGPTFRKIDPAFPVLMNGSPVTDVGPVRLAHGDRLAVGSADLTVSISAGLLRPRFVPFSPPNPDRPEASGLPGNPTRVLASGSSGTERSAEVAALAAEREELTRLRSRLEAQARELEADRVVWYQRRQEIEAECRRLREQGMAPDPSQPRLAEAREQETLRLRSELESIRDGLLRQYEERRAELERMQEQVQRSSADLENEIARRVEAAVAQRLKEVDAAPDADGLREERQSLAAERARLAEDLVRLERRQADLDERQRELDPRAAEVDARLDQLRRDAAELEENVLLAEAEQDRLTAESSRLARFRAETEAQASRLAERSAQLDAQQAMLAVFRARLDRQQEEAREETIRLAADRSRLDAAQRELDERLREVGRAAALLSTEREDHAAQARLTADRAALLEAAVAEIQQQKEALAAEHSRLQAKETELDARSADIAEQAALLKARLQQTLELQERLETDRSAVREREATLTDADVARQTFQEQLRRRSEELAARSRHLDDVARRLAEQQTELDRLRSEFQSAREEFGRATAANGEELAAREAALEKKLREVGEREAGLSRQVARLRETGRSVAAARKEMAQARSRWDAEQREMEAFRARAAEGLDALRREAPELEDRARDALERLTSVRDVLRGQLGELHSYAGQGREELEVARAELRREADRLRDREDALEKARTEHRLAVAEFRQQLIEWQARVGDLRQTMTHTETRLDSRRAEVDATAREAEAAAIELSRQADELRRERQQVAERRTEVERHLTDMREWYRKKLRELAADRRPSPAADNGPTILPLSGADEPVDPGDRQLGELLRERGLVDADTLDALWAEAGRQRRTLRHVLLASGTITLYQLALIEAGNLDGLVLGRFRVIERVRAGSREAVYRVFDPTRADGPTRGLFLLRHLGESEMEDAVRPDEFRQRFAAARDAAHPNLVNTVEVLEIDGRPAALQEWPSGLASADWPAEVAVPGVWVRLLAAAAGALEAAHRAGLVHGHLSSESFLLTAGGELKLLGVGEPPWLAGTPRPEAEASPGFDLRSLGQLAFGWSQADRTTPRRRGRGKGFPESLLAVVRRLEADPETPMADTVPGAMPYRSAADLAADLGRLAALFPCPPDAWDRLVAVCADLPGDGSPLRRTA